MAAIGEETSGKERQACKPGFCEQGEELEVLKRERATKKPPLATGPGSRHPTLGTQFRGVVKVKTGRWGE